MITGSGQLTRGAGTFTLTGASDYTGGTFINTNSTTIVGNATALGSTSGQLTITGGAGRILDLNGFDITVGNLTGTNGRIRNNGTGDSTLTIGNGDNGGGVFAGVIENGTQNTALTKTGNATITLSGANTYTGLTTVSGGTLALGAAGSINDSSGVALAGGTFDVSAKAASYGVKNLTGSGSVVGALTVTTELAIGNSAGTINFDNDLTLGGSSTYTYELTGGASAADLANVSGTLTITSGATLDLVQLGTYTLGDKFTLFAYTTRSGTFAGLNDGTEFTDSGGLWKIDYFDDTAGLNGGTGTNYVTVTAIPEPSAALLGSLGLLALLRRRRN